MTQKTIVMNYDKSIALVAHDHKKRDLLAWAKYNRALLANYIIYATGSLRERELELPINKLQSGPLGGDQQVGQ